jgi:hypothetical protein
MVWHIETVAGPIGCRYGLVIENTELAGVGYGIEAILQPVITRRGQSMSESASAGADILSVRAVRCSSRHHLARMKPARSHITAAYRRPPCGGSQRSNEACKYGFDVPKVRRVLDDIGVV